MFKLFNLLLTTTLFIAFIKFLKETFPGTIDETRRGRKVYGVTAISG